MTEQELFTVPDGWITTTEAAEIAGYRPGHIRRLAKQGRILAQKIARDWLISQDSLMEYKETVRPGRPRKEETEEAA